MFSLYKYDFFWAFLIISILVPILECFISIVLASISKGSEKLSTYESGIEPMGVTCLQFGILYYMFALVFVVFDVEMIFLYPWAMSFDVLGVSVFKEAFIFILIIGLVYAWRKGALEWFSSEYSDSKNKNRKNKIESVMNFIQFPLLDRTALNSVISTTLNDLSNRSRLSSSWPLLYGTNCCFIEFASSSRFDFDR